MCKTIIAAILNHPASVKAIIPALEETYGIIFRLKKDPGLASAYGSLSIDDIHFELKE